MISHNNLQKSIVTVYLFVPPYEHPVSIVLSTMDGLPRVTRFQHIHHLLGSTTTVQVSNHGILVHRTHTKRGNRVDLLFMMNLGG